MLVAKPKRLTMFEYVSEQGHYWLLFAKLPKGAAPGFSHRVLIFRRPADTTPVYKDWLATDFPADAKSAAFFFAKAIEHGSIT